MGLAGQAEFDETLVAAGDAKMQVRHSLSVGFPLPFFLIETVPFIVATLRRMSSGSARAERFWDRSPTSASPPQLPPPFARATPLCPFVTGLALPFLDLSLPEVLVQPLHGCLFRP